MTLSWSHVINTLFAYIVWKKGYFHPFPHYKSFLTSFWVHATPESWLKYTITMNTLRFCAKWWKIKWNTKQCTSITKVIYYWGFNDTYTTNFKWKVKRNTRSTQGTPFWSPMPFRSRTTPRQPIIFVENNYNLNIFPIWINNNI